MVGTQILDNKIWISQKGIYGKKVADISSKVIQIFKPWLQPHGRHEWLLYELAPNLQQQSVHRQILWRSVLESCRNLPEIVGLPAQISGITVDCSNISSAFPATITEYMVPEQDYWHQTITQASSFLDSLEKTSLHFLSILQGHTTHPPHSALSRLQILSLHRPYFSFQYHTKPPLQSRIATGYNFGIYYIMEFIT